MKMRNVVIGVCVGAVLGVGVHRVILEKGSGSVPAAAHAEHARHDHDAPKAPPAAQPVFKVQLGGSPQKGRDDAKVTIVEWSDFQCPFCSRGMETLREVEQLYGAEVRVVFKHNPLPMHADAPFAATAASAAGRQGKFWQMHDKLFEASARGAQTELARAKVEQYARELGLDMERWGRDVVAKDVEDEIRSDQAQALALGAQGSPHFFVNGVRISGAQPVESFKRVIDAQLERADGLLARGVSRKELYAELIKDGLTGPPPAPPRATVQVYSVDPGDGPSRGGKNPKVTIVEWSDFECDFCSRAEPTIKKILDTYKDDVRVVWRNKPLQPHPQAMPAAKAAMAAHRQGRFWQMHDKLLAGQQQLSSESYLKWARQIGLDVARFKRDIQSQAIADLIDKDSAYADSLGARGTPVFFIDGKRIIGARPFELFKPIIEEEIRKADELLEQGTPREKLYDALVTQNLQAFHGMQKPIGESSSPVVARK